MRLEIRHWCSHLNMLVFSLLYHCEENNIEFDFYINSTVAWNSAILYFNNQEIYFDYSDDSVFIENPEKFDCYFKRSLLINDFCSNVYPLNFQVNYSYKAFKLLSKFGFKELLNKSNRVELFRAVDYFGFFTNSSHNVKDIRKFPKEVRDNKGKVIFYTRLWNPENNTDVYEKERRRIQNNFRIESCRIIKNNFENARVGLLPDVLSSKLAPDLLLDKNKTSINGYFRVLRNSDIGIADDGLKDTPGWKIGEYLLHGKAVITTPLNIVTENFEEHVNFEKLSTRSSFEELPGKIDYLLKNKKYLDMGCNNLEWSDEYLHPKNYIKRILSVIGLNSK